MNESVCSGSFFFRTRSVKRKRDWTGPLRSGEFLQSETRDAGLPTGPRARVRRTTRRSISAFQKRKVVKIETSRTSPLPQKGSLESKRSFPIQKRDERDPSSSNALPKSCLDKDRPFSRETERIGWFCAVSKQLESDVFKKEGKNARRFSVFERRKVSRESTLCPTLRRSRRRRALRTSPC